MNYLGRWAQDDRLESLRSVLQQIEQEAGINVSETWIDKKLETLQTLRAAKQAQPIPECDTPHDFEGNDRIHVDKTAVEENRRIVRAVQSRSESARINWTDHDIRRRIIAGMKASWAGTTGARRREHLSEIMTARMAIPAARQHLSDVTNKFYENPDNRKAVSEKSLKRFEDPAESQKLSETNTFRRNDSDPKLKKQWDSKITAAEKYVANNPTPKLTNSFHTLRLDPIHYGLPASAPPKPHARSNAELERVRHAFFTKAMTEYPSWSIAGRANLIEEIKYTLGDKKLKGSLTEEVHIWMRAAERLREHNVLVDYAAHPQLMWMKP
jgi:hypothetical protein